MTLAGRFSLDEVFGSDKQNVKIQQSEEKIISQDVATLLSNFSNIIGIVSYEREITPKQKPLKKISVSRTI